MRENCGNWIVGLSPLIHVFGCVFALHLGSQSKTTRFFSTNALQLPSCFLKILEFLETAYVIFAFSGLISFHGSRIITAFICQFLESLSNS